MGPIFSEYLFIRFFARAGEKADDDRYWPLPKFQELLMQMRYHEAPDQSLVTGGMQATLLQNKWHDFNMSIY